MEIFVGDKVEAVFGTTDMAANNMGNSGNKISSLFDF